MNSLHAHISGDHSGVPFHPACPICREQRLFGELPSGAQAGRRRAAMLAAALATSSLGLPSAALANGPVATPTSVQDNQGASSGENVPTGEEPESPSDDGPGASDPGADADQNSQGGNLITPDPEPTHAAPKVPPATPPAPPPPKRAPAQAGPPPRPVVKAPPAPPPAKPPPVAPPTHTSEKPVKRPSKRPAGTNSSRPKRQVEPSAAPAAPSTITSTPYTPAPSPPPAPVSSAPATQASVQPAAAKPGGATHVVNSGESLWLIAQSELGPDASNATIVHFVQQLWALNAGRIASHDPDQLAVGETLRLPGR